MLDVEKHHPWCNYWMAGPVETCKMCACLFKLYPLNSDDTSESLMSRHFKDNVIVKESSDEK